MSTVQGNIVNHTGDKVAPNTLTSAVYDAAKGQALSQTLVNTPDKGALGYPSFSTVLPYAIGDVVYHENKLWKFTSAHSAGAWDSTQVTEFSIKDLADAIIEASGSAESLLGDLKLALGYAAEKTTIVLTAGETGKYVKCSTRAAAANANFNISAPFDVDACTELLVKTGYNPSDNTHAALDISVISIFEEIQRTRTVQKKNGSNQPLYYVIVVDPETGSITVTDEETTEDTGYPVYVQETYTEQRYLPNNEDRWVKIPDTGYYVANIPQSCKCVVSYKPGVTDLNVIAIKYGCLANLTSQLYGIYEHRVMAEAVASLAYRLQAVEDGLGKFGRATADTVDANEFTSCRAPRILRGHGAPAASTKPDNWPAELYWDGIPYFAGQIYINLDAASGGLYYAKGNGAVSDWINA